MRVALVLNDDFSMWQFRKGLISALIARGMEVYVVTPDGPYVPLLTGLSAKHFGVKMNRFINPVADLKLFIKLYRFFRSAKIELVHTMTLKPNIYGTLAARLAGVRRVVGLVSGLGYGFSESGGWKQRVI